MLGESGLQPYQNRNRNRTKTKSANEMIQYNPRLLCGWLTVALDVQVAHYQFRWN
jgi:hypothetical protein